MVIQRKSVRVALAVVMACGIWGGLTASPAAAAPPGGTVVASLTGTVRTVSFAGTEGASLAATHICRTHDWYYRIFLTSGQTLFRWTFKTMYCFFPNNYWFAFNPTDTVTLQHSDIRGSTVRYRILASNGINGQLMLLYHGASFDYCPNGGACTQTFTPSLSWIYKLDDTRIYTGSPPLE